MRFRQSLGRLPDATIEILRQTDPIVPRNVGYTWWLYERSPYTRGTWDDGVRVVHKTDGAEGVIVGTRLMPASTILVQVRWDGEDYAPGECDVAPEWDLEPLGRGAPLLLDRVVQLTLPGIEAP